MKRKRALLVRSRNTRVIDLERLAFERSLLVNKLNTIEHQSGVVSRQLHLIEDDLRWHDFMVFCHTGRFPG